MLLRNFSKPDQQEHLDTETLERHKDNITRCCFEISNNLSDETKYQAAIDLVATYLKTVTAEQLLQILPQLNKEAKSYVPKLLICVAKETRHRKDALLIILRFSNNESLCTMLSQSVKNLENKACSACGLSTQHPIRILHNNNQQQFAKYFLEVLAVNILCRDIDQNTKYDEPMHKIKCNDLSVQQSERLSEAFFFHLSVGLKQTMLPPQIPFSEGRWKTTPPAACRVSVHFNKIFSESEEAKNILSASPLNKLSFIQYLHDDFFWIVNYHKADQPTNFITRFFYTDHYADAKKIMAYLDEHREDNACAENVTMLFNQVHTMLEQIIIPPSLNNLEIYERYSVNLTACRLIADAERTLESTVILK